MVLTGSSNEALNVARKIEEAEPRSEALVSIATALAKTGKLEESGQAAIEALEAIRKIENVVTRSRLLVSVVEALAKAGNSEVALDIARKIKNAASRSQALVSAVEVLARGREAAVQARSAIEEAQQLAEQMTNMYNKSTALANVAMGLAKLHLYRQARGLVDNNNTSAKDKLTAYTAILREYYIERHPDQAKLFEEERQKED